MKLLARLTISKFKPIVIGVTGSVGKTSTKEAIYTILYRSKVSRRNLANLNNELGISLTVLGDYAQSGSIFFWLGVICSAVVRLIMPKFFYKYPEVLVLEYGATEPGDLDRAMEICKPHIAIVTAIGDMPVHAEFYGDADAVAREKMKLVKALKPDGVAILNTDDPRVLAMRDATIAKVITYGFAESADVKISNLRTETNPLKVNFTLSYKDSSESVSIEQTAGKIPAYSSAAGAAVAIALNHNLEKIAPELSKYVMPTSRISFIKCKNDILLVDDSYNSSPLAVRAVIETIKDIPASPAGGPAKRKVAILGDMLELGKFSEQAHTEIGRLAHEVFDVVVAVGEESKLMNADFWYPDAQSALEPIKKLLQPGDLVLVKASHSIGLSAIANDLRK